MRTSLIDIEKIENWLLERGDIQERLLTESRVLSNTEWRDQAQWQSESYELIRLYGREKLREEIKVIEHNVFHTKKHQRFQNLIKSVFTR
jgi:hypothetical protein